MSENKDLGRAASGQALASEALTGLQPTAFDPSRVRAWLVSMTKYGEDNVWRGAEKALQYLDALEASLVPFASYMDAMDAYASLHRGQHLPDNKVLAYSQTETGTSGALVVGHFRDAQYVVCGLPNGGWSGIYRSKVRETQGTPHAH